MSLAQRPNTAQSRLQIPEPVEALLAGEGIYQLHLRLLMGDSRVVKAMHHFDQVRRSMHANPGNDVMAMLGQINDAQQVLVSAMKNALAPHPNLQSKLKQMSVQLALIDGLGACVLI